MISRDAIRNDLSRHARNVNVNKVYVLERLFFIIDHLFFYRRHLVSKKHGVRLRVYFLNHGLIGAASALNRRFVAIKSFPNERNPLPHFAVRILQKMFMLRSRFN
jgi:hypothetical protein